MSNEQTKKEPMQEAAAPKLVKSASKRKQKILFLGYSEKQTTLLDELIKLNCEVWHTEEKIKTTSGYDLVISYGYRHILPKYVIESSPAPIVNLHISYLPWNRGAHPNFWSFYDSTPSGVSIHLIDEGIDTGPIIYQKYVNFSAKEKTFSQTYKKLTQEIEQLFKENIENIVTKNFVAIPQRKKGSYHRTSDLPKDFSSWDSEFQIEVTRLDKILSQE
ncbi:formyltransferase family protein [Pseudomonas gingeri]|nr:formyltransferase family protein [Pseudomonas gingeri]